MPNHKAEEIEEVLNWDGRIVDNDVKALQERKWKNIARNREICQNLLRKAMATKGQRTLMHMETGLTHMHDIFIC
jgi:hypothetical protein